ncbi:MAG: ATP-binding cassette domain-containing protein, partial [Planctomycetota bacterium]
QMQEAERSGALVTELKHVSFAYDEQPILDDFSTSIMRGDKVGIIGRNGVGKTTLLKIMLGQLKPHLGTVRVGTKVQVAYFDQLRDTLDNELSVADNVADGSDRVQIGETTKHIYGYLQDFLFTPERARSEVKFLSGGERNRVLLAKLMTMPANVIVLDEPTNDLDSETLELLEEQISSFGGTVLMVSHDRAFLNNVVTSTLVFEKDGIREYVGGYDDWRRVADARSQSELDSKSEDQSVNQKKPVEGSKPVDRVGQRTKKLSYKDQRELDELPDLIETLESEISTLHEAMGDPEYYQRPAEELTADGNRLKELESSLEAAFARWEELESESGG